MTEEQLQQLKIGAEWLEPINAAFNKWDINTPERRAGFLGQCMHESGHFKTLQENLNYSAQSLCKVWPARFPTLDLAQEYARNPSKIANRVYSGRMGNGDEASGDGWRYRGRGLIQLTGKDNYRKAGDALGEDLIANPDQVSEPRMAALTAGWFWKSRGLNEIADRRDWELITRRINGGVLGLEERIALIEQCLLVFA